jgi:hypothetical protein
MVKSTEFFAKTAAWALLGLAFGLAGCGAEGQASSDSAEQLGKTDEALVGLTHACAQYEAETQMAHSGGSLSSDGAAWKLTAINQNVSASRQVVAGTHKFSIFAKASSDVGTFPKLRLSLNGIQIGTDITVSNTSAMQEYTVLYNVTTANQKTIKVELINTSPRSVSIDGVNVFCPGKVACEPTGLSCDLCCLNLTTGASTCEGICGGPGALPAVCDQHTDCGPGSFCSMVTNGQAAAVTCRGPQDLPSSGNVFNREVCKSPQLVQTTCVRGGVCRDSGLPGWKTCQP